MSQEKQKIIGLVAIGKSGTTQQRSKTTYLNFPAINRRILLQRGLLLRVDFLRSQATWSMECLFSRPGTRPAASYSKSAYSKTGLSASVQHVMGAHDIKAGFDYNQHTMRSILQSNCDEVCS